MLKIKIKYFKIVWKVRIGNRWHLLGQFVYVVGSLEVKGSIYRTLTVIEYIWPFNVMMVCWQNSTKWQSDVNKWISNLHLFLGKILWFFFFFRGGFMSSFVVDSCLILIWKLTMKALLWCSCGVLHWKFGDYQHFCGFNWI